MALTFYMESWKEVEATAGLIELAGKIASPAPFLPFSRMNEIS